MRTMCAPLDFITDHCHSLKEFLTHIACVVKFLDDSCGFFWSIGQFGEVLAGFRSLRAVLGLYG